MPIRDLLKKKEKADSSPADNPAPPLPEFSFMRSDTHTEEVLFLPDHPPDELYDQSSVDGSGDGRRHRFSKLTGRSRSASVASNTSRSSDVSKSKDRPQSSKRLSQRLGLRKEESSSSSVPQDLPEIKDEQDDGDAWEQRATMLARENEKNRSRPGTPMREHLPDLAALKLAESTIEGGVVASKNTDDNIQEAIRLHEAGELEKATNMFGRLADPNGGNNALSQVLYGLALRHGWGCTADPGKAMVYLSAAASNAALIENLALQAGRKGGGAAKGELVLAIFELANSFRHGWGVKKDPIAAKQYYETAANLGDTDAMNEVGWCYLEGFGCKKDKLKAAKYYRLAEGGGSKILGNSWYVHVSSFVVAYALPFPVTTFPPWR